MSKDKKDKAPADKERVPKMEPYKRVKKFDYDDPDPDDDPSNEYWRWG